MAYKNNTKIDLERERKWSTCARPLRPANRRAQTARENSKTKSISDGDAGGSSPHQARALKGENHKAEEPYSANLNLQRIRGSLLFCLGLQRASVTQLPGCSAAFLRPPSDTLKATPACADMFSRRSKRGATWKWFSLRSASLCRVSHKSLQDVSLKWKKNRKWGTTPATVNRSFHGIYSTMSSILFSVLG